MFASIIVGTDGSETATTAVRYAIDLARELGARLQIVSAYEPVSEQRLRTRAGGGAEGPAVEVNPHDQVMAMLEQARQEAVDAGSRTSRPTPVRAMPPTRSSTSPRRAAPT